MFAAIFATSGAANLLLWTSSPAVAQDSERQMESMLNRLEASPGYQQGMQTQQNRLNQQQQQMGGFQNAAPGYQNAAPGFQGNNAFAYPQQAPRSNSFFSQSPLHPQQAQAPGPFGGLFGGAQQMGQQAAPRMPMTKRDLLRVFLEGGSPKSSSSSNDAQKQANNQRKYNSAASYRQTAEDAAMRALGAEERTRYGNKSSRMSAASEAYYAASAARGAANSATSAAAGGALNANDAAASARNAADRAQASADRARSNADSYRDN